MFSATLSCALSTSHAMPMRRVSYVQDSELDSKVDMLSVKGVCETEAGSALQQFLYSASENQAGH